MIQSVNIQEVKQNLLDTLKDTGWDKQLRTFFLGSDLDIILETLLKEAQDNRRFTPQIRNIFKFLSECPYDSVKAVFINDSPYPELYSSDGLALSCGLKEGSIESPLLYVENAVKESVSDELKLSPPVQKDLTPWANQGVLLINVSLTTTLGKRATHENLWQPLVVSILDSLIMSHHYGLSFVFLGKKAHTYGDLIPDNHLKIFVDHPHEVLETTSKEWDYKDMFNRINTNTFYNRKPLIHW